MDFEEFFRKKRIDMAALQTVQPSLFSEFKTHFVEMGEKSFDHTKKYWFNKLRHEFPLAVEPKLEKVKIDNPLAEQTITESLIEQSATAPKLGFTPKFRTAATPPKPVEAIEENKPEETVVPAAKLGFTPKFRASSPPKQADATEDNKSEEPSVPAPKLGFTPKFKAANMPKPATEAPAEQPAPIESTETPLAEDTAPKPAYKPRFNMKNIPKKEE